MLKDYQGQPFKDSVYPGGPQGIPGRLFCAYYDFGGEGVAYHDTDAVNHGSGELNPSNGSYLHEFRKNEGVDITYVKSNREPPVDDTFYNWVQPEANLLYVGWTEPGEWVKYTVDVKQTGLYSVSLLYTSNRGGEIALSVNDQDASGPIKIQSTFHPDDPLPWRQWHHWNKMTGMVKIKLEKGIQVITLHTVAEGNMNYAYLDFDLVGE